MLSNIRLYGPASKTHAAFAGDLPFGVRFGDTREALIARFGVPDVEVAYIPLLRWDTERYALFAELDKSGRLQRLSLQLPVVTTNRSGFEARQAGARGRGRGAKGSTSSAPCSVRLAAIFP